jgi:hypothetical protein
MVLKVRHPCHLLQMLLKVRHPCHLLQMLLKVPSSPVLKGRFSLETRSASAVIGTSGCPVAW